MKIKWKIIPALASPVIGLVLTGCEGMEGVPYNPDTPAARIHAGAVPKEGASTNTVPVTVPVEPGDPEVAKYLDFSAVRVVVEEKNGRKLVTAFSTVSPKKMVWRVSLFKDGKEVHHFLVSNIHHLFDEVIPLDPLALDAGLPVPDKIIVTTLPSPAP